MQTVLEHQYVWHVWHICGDCKKHNTDYLFAYKQLQDNDDNATDKMQIIVKYMQVTVKYMQVICWYNSIVDTVKYMAKRPFVDTTPNVERIAIVRLDLYASRTLWGPQWVYYMFDDF